MNDNCLEDAIVVRPCSNQSQTSTFPYRLVAIGGSKNKTQDSHTTFTLAQSALKEKSTKTQ